MEVDDLSVNKNVFNHDHLEESVAQQIHKQVSFLLDDTLSMGYDLCKWVMLSVKKIYLI